MCPEVAGPMVAGATWSKWVVLITQRARLGKPNRPGILEESVDWPKSRDFGALPEKVAHAQEALRYNELSEKKRRYALPADGFCHVVGNHRKWKPAVESPTRQVVEATEGEEPLGCTGASQMSHGPSGMVVAGVSKPDPVSFHTRLLPAGPLFWLADPDCLGTAPLRPAAMSGKSLLLKVILLGDGGVGKSSLMNRYVTNKFDSQAFHTIGVEFLNRDLEVDGRFVTLQIWDTAGQERFKSLRTPFYRGADCCLLTFSVDDRQSFENLSNWQKEFVYYADVKDPEHFPFVVLGNKIDKLERQVSTEEAQAWCMENGNYPYLETSAKDDTNVAVAFEEAVRQVLAVEEQLEHCMLGHTIDLHTSSKSGSSCC
ncbi:ras-related protein rab-9b [Limosa lapponica baueri]|uniref:small monomeric GTPase n=3 Tax=Neoaves TaxID=3078114 RepID=A0A2I0TDP2_LIMLA|nr:ras-related protein rab-9b [Limosa lapponica baueri]